MLDDEPVKLRTRTRSIVNLPYTQECNDVAMMLIQHHKAAEYYDRAVDQFDQLHRDAAHSARVLALVVHPYIMGAPHRLKYFRDTLAHIRQHEDVLFWTGEEILDWFLSADRAEVEGENARRLGASAAASPISRQSRGDGRNAGDPGSYCRVDRHRQIIGAAYLPARRATES